MIQFFSKKLRNRKGFTLVELLIVIAVLGILAGIAVPRMLGVTDQFRVNADKRSAEVLARETEVLLLSGKIDKTATFSIPETGEGATLTAEKAFGDATALTAQSKVATTGVAKTFKITCTKTFSDTGSTKWGVVVTYTEDTTATALATRTFEMVE